MNREIKFKAEHEGKVYAVAVITNKKVQMYGVSGWVDRAKVTLLQFTGVQDSRGVDIYEGNIVRFFDGWLYPIEWNEDVSYIRLTSNQNPLQTISHDVNLTRVSVKPFLRVF